jgi:hypothetical protein
VIENDQRLTSAMAPPDPPPYTMDEILKMNTPEEQLRARVELTSMCKRRLARWKSL